MKGVTFDVTIPRFLLAKSAGRVSESVLFGRLSGVRYGEVPEPGLPGADWVKLDVQYIDSWSLSLDFEILMRTVPAVLRGTGI